MISRVFRGNTLEVPRFRFFLARRYRYSFYSICTARSMQVSTGKAFQLFPCKIQLRHFPLSKHVPTFLRQAQRNTSIVLHARPPQKLLFVLRHGHVMQNAALSHQNIHQLFIDVKILITWLTPAFNLGYTMLSLNLFQGAPHCSSY